MQIGILDHVNLRTSQLDHMVRWYEDILGMKAGRRPGFSFPGAWLYSGDQAWVHLVGIVEEAAQSDPLKLEHFAMQATGLESFLSTLKANDIGYQLIAIPDFPIVQVNIFDPDGTHIHIDFHSDEADAMGLEVPMIT